MAAADPKALWLMQGWLFRSVWWSNDRIKVISPPMHTHTHTLAHTHHRTRTHARTHAHTHTHTRTHRRVSRPAYHTYEQAYLSGVNNDNMLILDLYAEVDPIWSKTESYFGCS
jgi:hypothetical protein